MKVFIENEADSAIKHLYNEKTLTFIKTIEVARKYPYPYGFILDTTGEDGDNVDVFVLTTQKLKRGQIIECEPIGLMEQFEKSWDSSKAQEEIDHNVLAVVKGDMETKLNHFIKQELTEFVSHVFDTIQENKTRVGAFLDKNTAMEYINQHRDGAE